MKKTILNLIIIITVTVVSHIYPATTQAQSAPEKFELTPERIESFQSEAVLYPSGDLEIIETITHVTPAPKHGIYRYVPFRYRQELTEGWTLTSLPLRNISIERKDSDDIPYEESTENGNFFWKIGDPDETYTGSKEYHIEYTITEALASNGLLRWNVTGDGWQLPLENVSASLRLSEEFSSDAKILKRNCVVGVPGAGKDDECETITGESTTLNVAETRLAQNETMTVEITIPKSVAPSIGSLERWSRFIRDNWFWGLVFIPGLVMTLAWYRYGRDEVFYTPPSDPTSESLAQKPTTKESLFSWDRISPRAPLVLQPPAGITPAEATFILQESVDTKALPAELLILAQKQLLSIEREEEDQSLLSKAKAFFGQNQPVFRFTKETGANNRLKQLTPAQRTLYEDLFDNRDAVTTEELRGEFYKTVSQFETDVRERSMRQGWYHQKPMQQRGLGLAAAGVLSAIALFGGITSAALLVPIANLTWIGLWTLSAALAAWCGYHLPRRTAVGHYWRSQLVGLRETIKRGRWREKIKEKHLFVDEVLPFAVGLGVVTALAKDLDDLGIAPPDYATGMLTGTHAGTAGDLSSASESLASFQDVTTSSLSYNPSSGSSSGGGFSSGGGVGGGGGGSW